MKPVTTAIWACFLGGSMVFLPAQTKDQTPSSRDADRILTQSAWAQQAGAQFDLAADDEAPPPPPAPAAGAAGLAGSGVQGAPRWDGEPARADRMGTPTLNVLIRWDSAARVREALKAKGEPAPTEEQVTKDYVVTILGLVPANRYYAAGSTASKSSSDDSTDARNPESVLEGLMGNSSLRIKGRVIAPENVRIERDGSLHLYFARTADIRLSDKEVTVNVRFGGMSVSKRFRLKDMRYRGELEL